MAGDNKDETGVLARVQELYSSDDPRERIVGVFGKAIVELGSAAIVVSILLAFLYSIDAYVSEIDPFATELIRILISLGAVGFLVNAFLCEMILDLREFEEEESTEGSAGAAPEDSEE